MLNVSSEHSFNPSYFELGIHTWFKWGIYTPLKSQLPTSIYGMDLKLEEVLVRDRRRR